MASRSSVSAAYRDNAPAIFTKEALPTRLLLIAMFKNIMTDIRGEGVCSGMDMKGLAAERKQLKRAAVAFVFDERDDPLTFEWLCSNLQLDVEWIRENIKNGRYLEWDLAQTRGDFGRPHEERARDLRR